MTTTETPAADLASEARAALDTAKDHLAALERAAAQGLEVNATDFNTAVTDIELKTRRQAFLDKAHTAESVSYLAALFDAAERLNTDAQAHVDAIQAALDRATRLAADIKANASQETYGAALSMGLPLVEDIGDLDGELATNTRVRGLESREITGRIFRLDGRVFGSQGLLPRSPFTRPKND